MTRCRKFICQLLEEFTFQRVSSSRQFHVSSSRASYPKLTPTQVTSILRACETGAELRIQSSVKGFDGNQLMSNNPVEDAYFAARCVLTTGMLFGVFDGHGGNSCAQVVSQRLYSYLAATLLSPQQLVDWSKVALSGRPPPPLLEPYMEQLEFVDELKELYENSFRAFIEHLLKNGKGKPEFSMQHAFQKSFVHLDNDMSREALESIGKSAQAATSAVALSGCVACVALVDGPHLHVANLGDCAAVLGSQTDTGRWVAQRLSREHNTENSAEVNRILKEHPSNERDTVIKHDRLLGQLAPLRAMGDFRFKWKLSQMKKFMHEAVGSATLPQNYYTPPYLSSVPDVTSHRLTARDRFLILATDGLWEQLQVSQVVRLVGEHMSGKVTLTPLRLPKKPLTMTDINGMLLLRKEGLKSKPLDSNATTHLLRQALGGTEYGIEHSKLSQMLSMPEDVVRNFRDDITMIIIYFDPDYLRSCPL